MAPTFSRIIFSASAAFSSAVSARRPCERPCVPFSLFPTGSGNAAGQGVFQRYKLSRRDGLHWSFARCAQMPDAESLARWEKLRTAQLERMRAKAEKQAAEK